MLVRLLFALLALSRSRRLLFSLCEELPQLPASPSEIGASEQGLKSTFSLGETLKLEALGPIIINADGTTRRIANWATLTNAEQESAWVRISRRNKARLEQIKKAKQIEQEIEEHQEVGREESTHFDAATSTS